ncbi:Sucrose-phosphatase-like N-terminal [Arabidopsis suecica]|uniref:Sucrose-phosphatase n=1 Tax=Arabidopsis suecica TaxID=45249 RepID=A0A8T2CZS3_ARASU|nr:Sucrose-phosphatase-like N-terminal [Arabidopsis suecica]
MERLTSPPHLMIVSDLDETMVDHHKDPENLSLLRFNSLWEDAYRHDSLLVFSTGRAQTMYKKLRKERPLLTPDVIITSVGTEIAYGNSMVLDDNWVEILNNKWDRGIVEEETSKFPELTLQGETEQRPHKLSFNIDKSKVQAVTKKLSQRLEKRGVDIKIIFSGGNAFDVLPKGGGKGQALAYLLKKLKTEGKLPVNTLACGDSGNDTELFTIPNVYGVMVSNAQEELLEWYAENAKENPNIIHANERCAGGIIQAIGHFKLGPNLSPRDVSDFLECKADNVNPGHEVVKFFLFYERWRRGEVENCETYTASLKASCHPAGVFVHPSGAEKSLRDTIDELGKYYGDMKGKKFRVWTDQVLATDTTPGTWIVKLDKWEQIGDERKCCTTTVKFTSKEGEGFVWEHVQQIWSEETEIKKDDSNWII